MVFNYHYSLIATCSAAIQADLQLNMMGIHSPPAGDEAQLALRMRSSRQKATANIVPAQLLHLSRD